ncbi:MAG TPA: carboxymuconolactone decarboxylase family protein [Kofleriaceae bacterium]|jgi:uncharacterized peroxidase-related enzyme
MSRIPTPASIEASPAASQPLLEAVKRQLGSVPNMFRIIGNSPPALEGYLGLSGALSGGQLDAKTRTRIAMAVAEANGCDYCLSAHTYLGTNLVKLDAAELTANRDGSSGDTRAAAALRFARKLVVERGRVASADIEAVKAAGYSAPEVIEIIMHVALNTLTNYVNTAVATEIDFPVVAHRSI